jgi:hypothetical protein
MHKRPATKIFPRGEWRAVDFPGGWWRWILLLMVTMIGFRSYGNEKAVPEAKRTYRLSSSAKPEVATALVECVQAFVVAGENNDPAVRGKYLGPKVFYFGHARSREQAVKEIASLYRRWPRRKFTLTDSIDLFEIPNHQDVYRVTAVYEYKFENLNERLSGKSKLNCVVENDRQGTRIIGVDEKLISGSTAYQKE